MNHKLTRREFLKLGTISIGGLAVGPRLPHKPPSPTSGSGVTERLGRVSADYVTLRSRPNPDGIFLGYLFFDDVVPIYREVVGKGWHPHNHVWFETRDGYAYSASVQPVENVLNEPVLEIPTTGFFGEVVVPFADARDAPDPGAKQTYRVYYSTVVLVDEIEQSPDASWWYHVQDDAEATLWIPAETLRLIRPEEVAPIAPDVVDKRVRVDLSRQTVSAFEGKTEVFRTLISSGKRYVKEGLWIQEQSTPVATSPIWSKRISRHMQGGTGTAGWDLPGVAWVSYFAGNGAALHATYWHNDFGRPRSAGCINCTPEAARWLFRWTAPVVDYVPGYVTVKWPGGTRVEVVATT